MSPKRKRQLYNIIGALLSVFFIYFCIHALGKEGLQQAFLVSHPWYLIYIVILNFFLMAVRTWKWRVLLNPIRRLPFWTLYDILHVGYMANNLLPFKAGEFFRASFVAKKWKIPYTQVLTTVGLERYFAGFCLILLFFVVATLLNVPTWLKSGVSFLAATLIGVQIALWILWKKRPDISKWEKRHPLIYRTILFFYHVGEGSQPLRSVKSFLLLLAIASLDWFGQGLMLKILEYAYNIHISWPSTLFVLIAINLAITLPSAPANLGTLEFAAIVAYLFVGVNKATGLGIGVFFHFLQVIPITLFGLFYYFRWGVRLKDIERMAENQEIGIGESGL